METKKTGEVNRQEIVVGYDGSTEAKAALRWAVRYAAGCGSDLRLVTAWQWPQIAAGMPALAFECHPELEAKRVAQDALTAVRLPGSQVCVDIPNGDAGVELVRLSKDAALLVVGSRGHALLASALLGSVSTYCAHHSAVPVAVVR